MKGERPIRKQFTLNMNADRLAQATRDWNMRTVLNSQTMSQPRLPYL
jgi:hypothetical protein